MLKYYNNKVSIYSLFEYKKCFIAKAMLRKENKY